MVYVIPAGSTSSQCFHDPSLSRLNEMDLVAAAVSGHLDPSLIVSPPGEGKMSLLALAGFTAPAFIMLSSTILSTANLVILPLASLCF